MADSAVNITEGTGTGIDTRTEATNGNHRQVVVLGDPSTNAGVAPVDATAGLKVDLGADNDVTITGSVAVTGTFYQATQPVSLASVPSHAVTNAGTFAVQDSGDVAHDAADSGAPVKVGFKAYANDGTAPQTAVAEGDRVNGIADLQGRQYVSTSHPFFFHVSADYAAAQTNASVKAAPGAGLSIYITTLSISNGATAGNITLLDGSGGTVLYEIYPSINGGATLSLLDPIKLTANTALCITSTTVTTHAVFVSGFIA